VSNAPAPRTPQAYTTHTRVIYSSIFVAVSSLAGRLASSIIPRRVRNCWAPITIETVPVVRDDGRRPLKRRATDITHRASTHGNWISSPIIHRPSMPGSWTFSPSKARASLSPQKTLTTSLGLGLIRPPNTSYTTDFDGHAMDDVVYDDAPASTGWFTSLARGFTNVVEYLTPIIEAPPRPDTCDVDVDFDVDVDLDLDEDDIDQTMHDITYEDISPTQGFRRFLTPVSRRFRAFNAPTTSHVDTPDFYQAIAKRTFRSPKAPEHLLDITPTKVSSASDIAPTKVSVASPSAVYTDTSPSQESVSSFGSPQDESTPRDAKAYDHRYRNSNLDMDDDEEDLQHLPSPPSTPTPCRRAVPRMFQDPGNMFPSPQFDSPLCTAIQFDGTQYGADLLYLESLQAIEASSPLSAGALTSTPKVIEASSPLSAKTSTSTPKDVAVCRNFDYGHDLSTLPDAPSPPAKKTLAWGKQNRVKDFDVDKAANAIQNDDSYVMLFNDMLTPPPPEKGSPGRKDEPGKDNAATKSDSTAFVTTSESIAVDYDKSWMYPPVVIPEPTGANVVHGTNPNNVHYTDSNSAEYAQKTNGARYPGFPGDDDDDSSSGSEDDDDRSISSEESETDLPDLHDLSDVDDIPEDEPSSAFEDDRLTVAAGAVSVTPKKEPTVADLSIKDDPPVVAPPVVTPPVVAPPVIAPAPATASPLIAPLLQDELDRIRNAAEASKGKDRHNYPVAKPGRSPLSPHDFSTLLPTDFNGHPKAWLNDNIVNEYLDVLIKRIWQSKGFKFVRGGPAAPVFALPSQWAETIQKNGPPVMARWAGKGGLVDEKFFDSELVLLPICDGSHWRLLAIKPRERVIQYYDSLGLSATKYTAWAIKFLKQVLGKQFVESDWTVQQGQKSMLQQNVSDCGIFTVLNALTLLRNEDCTRVVSVKGMEDARRRVAVTLLCGKSLELGLE
jgi:hypothetical protein